jgi:hypothetical protein
VKNTTYRIVRYNKALRGNITALNEYMSIQESFKSTS